MRGIVTAAYRRPYADPIRVAAGDTVAPDFEKPTDIVGWVWCAGPRGKSGWVPRAWLKQAGGRWRVDRDFDAIELDVTPGDALELHLELESFYWATTEDGRRGWVPGSHVEVVAA